MFWFRLFDAMFPVLLAIGPFTISSLGFFLALGFFFGSFSIWRRMKEEHFEDDDIFDAIFISFFLGLVIARLFFILFHFAQFGFSLGKWFNFSVANGFSWLGFMVGIIASLMILSKKKRWDFYQIIDLSTFGIVIAQIFLEIGLFLDGSALGGVTKLPWGLVFPGVAGKRHPLPIYELIILIGTYGFLRWLDSHYRLFSWYQDSRGEARPGILWLSYAGIFTLIQYLLDFISPRQPFFVVFTVYQIALLVMFFYLWISFWLRMGKKIGGHSGTPGSSVKKSEGVVPIRPAWPEFKPEERVRRFSRD